MIVAVDALNCLVPHLCAVSAGGNMNLLLGFTVLAFHRHHDKMLVGHRRSSKRRILTRTAKARLDCVGGTTVVQRWYKLLWPARRVAQDKFALLKEASEDFGGKRSWHNHNWLESPVVYATVGTIRKVNYATTCRRFIAGLSQNKVLSSMAVHTQIDLKINLARQKKNGPNFLYS